MSKGCGLSTSKYLLIVFNVFFWLSGCAILGVGIWFKVSPTIINFSEVIKIDAPGNVSFVDVVSFIFIAAGIFVFVVGFCGCCGAIRQSRLFLGAYIFCLVIIFGLEFAGGIVTLIKKDEISNSIQASGKDYIKTKYRFSDNAKDVDKALNYLMLSNDCCGVTGYEDFLNSTYLEVSLAPTHEGRELPMSYACCRSNRVHDDLLKVMDVGNQDPSAANATVCRKEAYGVLVNDNRDNLQDFHPDGCYAALNRWIDSHLIILIVVGCSVAAVELLGFIFALCLCRAIDPKGY